MATSAEQTFIRAVAAAEGTRQVAKAAAFATFAGTGFAPASQAAYIAALLAADVAYTTAVNSAVTTSALTLGNAGQSGPIAGNWASITGIL
jgi:hypothetical protein